MNDLQSFQDHFSYFSSRVSLGENGFYFRESNFVVSFFTSFMHLG